MKVQFSFDGNPNGYADIVAEFNVAEVPTEEQCKAVENDIYAAMEDWEEEYGDDFEDFDFWFVCHKAAREHLKLVDSPVVHTFYI